MKKKLFLGTIFLTGLLITTACSPTTNSENQIKSLNEINEENLKEEEYAAYQGLEIMYGTDSGTMVFASKTNINSYITKVSLGSYTCGNGSRTWLAMHFYCHPDGPYLDDVYVGVLIGNKKHDATFFGHWHDSCKNYYDNFYFPVTEIDRTVNKDEAYKDYYISAIYVAAD